MKKYYIFFFITVSAHIICMEDNSYRNNFCFEKTKQAPYFCVASSCLLNKPHLGCCCMIVHVCTVAKIAQQQSENVAFIRPNDDVLYSRFTMDRS